MNWIWPRLTAYEKLAGAMLAGLLFFYCVLPWIVKRFGGLGEWSLVVLSLLAPVLLTLLAISGKRILKIKSAAPIPLRQLPFGKITLIYLGGLILVGLGLWCWQMLLDTVGVGYGVPPSEQLFMKGSPLLVAVVAFAAILIAPVAEEVIFRDVLFNGFRARNGVVTSAALSAIIFAGLHATLLQLFPLLLLGLLFQYLVFRFQSLKAAMFAHFLNNLLAATAMLLLRFFSAG